MCPVLEEISKISLFLLYKKLRQGTQCKTGKASNGSGHGVSLVSASTGAYSLSGPLPHLPQGQEAGTHQLGHGDVKETVPVRIVPSNRRITVPWCLVGDGVGSQPVAA